MDWEQRSEQVIVWIKKYKYIAVILLLGIIMMIIPKSNEEITGEPPVNSDQESSLQESLGNILSKIAGAGNVEVLLTQSRGEEILYQTNESRTGSDIRIETVLVTDGNRTESGLIRQINAPVYLGAIVLCQGADSASVRLAIVDAVMSVTGLSSDCITVLKMK